MDVLDQLKTHVSQINWTTRLKMGGLIFGIYWVEVWRLPLYLLGRALGKMDMRDYLDDRFEIYQADEIIDLIEPEANNNNNSNTKQRPPKFDMKLSSLLFGVLSNAYFTYKFYKRYMNKTAEEQNAAITNYEKIGFSVAITGGLLKSLADYSLGRYSLFFILVQENQKISDSGLYRLIRHPHLLGRMLYQIGRSVFFQDYIEAGLGLLSLNFFGKRWKNEESFLLNQLEASNTDYRQRIAKEYAAYKEKVPYVWFPFIM